MMKWIARTMLRFTGWAPEGELPKAAKAVVIAAPHTSNWDGYYIILMGFALGIKFAWIGKKALFRGPLGWMLKTMNGIAIDRSGNLDLVTQLAKEFESRSELMLAIAPEGTRSHRDYWRSGFYHIAQTANVPIVMGYLDYG
ncbi:MAG: 1-acyl-sn-glycerol-3-phosphate acyltransferase, partial [Myxococcota bacterium]